MPWQHMHSLLFQSTLPREERHMTVQLHPHRRRFQSTLPREERPSLYLLGAHLHNFNPRSHERSDSQQSELITMLRISIHAPTRGATFTCESLRYLVSISIHAPTRGATLSGFQPILLLLFQSTLPREERLYDAANRAGYKVISIHAPTRGATNYNLCSPLLLENFNPRSHERSDSNIAQKICLFLYNTDNKYIIR